MGLKTWLDSKVKKMEWTDISLIKLSSVLFGLVIGAYFSAWILPYWWIVIILALLSAIKPLYKVFKKQEFQNA